MRHGKGIVIIEFKEEEIVVKKMQLLQLIERSDRLYKNIFVHSDWDAKQLQKR